MDIFVASFYVGNIVKMDDKIPHSLYFLEDEDVSQLFITQSSNNEDFEVESEGENNKFLGLDPMDFQLPCSSLLGNVAHYSDISKPEDESTSGRQM